MKATLKVAWKLFLIGGWAPAAVFATHVFIDQVIGAYELWPPIDIPMHLAGGLAIAFFISRLFRSLPRQAVPRSRLVILELVLCGSLTATAAVLWEFAEFTTDQLFGRNVQVGLPNTMKDLAMGISGALVFIIIRAARLRVSSHQIREVARDLVHGRAA
ncbi:MAG: hypothetical protein DMF49_10890 [Acidobacteria bacterium]|nr:MAG: hypothetical protein DMF49_10890 [Acidobacteriota bacterium]